MSWFFFPLVYFHTLVNVMLDLLTQWDVTSLDYVHFCSVVWTGWRALIWGWCGGEAPHGICWEPRLNSRTSPTKRLCFCEWVVLVGIKQGSCLLCFCAFYSNPVPGCSWPARLFVLQLAPTPPLARAIYHTQVYRQSCTSSPVALININNCKDRSESLAVPLPNPT